MSKKKKKENEGISTYSTSILTLILCKEYEKGRDTNSSLLLVQKKKCSK